ncbi:DUF1295 domain-containing protein [Arenimonas fontis]|uniref:DUF1295 domain-containing protein n=1 Tax=Arenimonas fontis TaxID=2608255 RepID=A0A5B2ZDD6_9GAMM|nr:DUF1295 domain-containing protein [Arenimonas fontis]KAA2286176.1 DUF1295 domain-containing protein [Arenimonas fontis]
MSPWLAAAQIWAAAALVMLLGWWRQTRSRNAGPVDVLWAGSLGAAAIFLGATGTGSALSRLSIGVLGGLWGLRLAWHLWRRVSREPEDGRYRYLRQHWRDDQVRFFLFYQGQALAVLLFSLPFLAVAANPLARPGPWWLAGIAIWCAGMLGEAVADRQLTRFREQPENRGRSCRLGLWRYSRHPNYFFEWTLWLGYACLAVGSPLAWLAWTGPVLMYVFLRWLSGIPWAEAQALRSRGEDYRDYQRRTPAFFPWFPKPDTGRSE